MAYLISKQRTRIGAKGDPRHVELRPGVRCHVPDGDLEYLGTWGKEALRRLERAGILQVLEGNPPPSSPAAPEALEGDDGLEELPLDLSGLTVRKAKPLIKACGELDTIRMWAEAEAGPGGKQRSTILDELEERFLELGGEINDPPPEADASSTPTEPPAPLEDGPSDPEEVPALEDLGEDGEG